MTDEELTSNPSKKEKMIVAETLEGEQYACHQNTDLKENALKFIPFSEKNNMISQDIFYLEQFTDPGINLKIIKPIQFNVSFEEDLYFIENDVFDIFSYHKELKKAKTDIEEQLQILWKDFVLEDESTLHETGILFKKLLQKYLEEF
ncbi:MAG: hypothetical protein FWH46_03550 [Methanimicrococcus sp.]|nr:hypothetical protein [Methanimicrococcus sp.]MCL2141935.1 hypothetical protein [Methanimicrococcus sp.]